MGFSDVQKPSKVFSEESGRRLSLVTEGSMDKESVGEHADITDGLPGGSTKKKGAAWWEKLFGSGKSADNTPDSFCSNECNSTDVHFIEEEIGTELDALGTDPDDKAEATNAKDPKASAGEIPKPPVRCAKTVPVEEFMQNGCASKKPSTLVADWEIIPIVTFEEFMAASFAEQDKHE